MNTKSNPPACWVEAITTEQALAAASESWSALSAASENALLFNSHEWASACWTHFHAESPNAELWVLVVRNAHRWLALLPLWRETRCFLGVVTRTAHLLGEGPSDYGDLLCSAPPQEPMDALVDYVLQRHDEWDVLDFRETPPNSAVATLLLPRLTARGCRAESTGDSPCRAIPTTDGWDDYYSRHFNSKRRRDHRRDRRIFDTTGSVTQEWLCAAAELPALADAFAEVQAAHAQAGENRPGEFNDRRFRPFIERMMTVAAQRDWLRISVMRRDGAVVAYYVAFHYRDRYCVYNTAHRADVQQYSVGKLLMLFTLERLFEERGGLIDFMRGDEPYKETWTDVCNVNLRIRITGATWHAKLAQHVAFELRPVLERRTPRLHRVLTVVSDEGWRGLMARVSRRLGADPRGSQ